MDEPGLGPPSDTSELPSQAEPPRGWKAKLRQKLGGAWGGLRVRDRLAKLRQQGASGIQGRLPRSMSRAFEPMAMAEWLGQLFQKGGGAAYGTLATLLLSTFFLADLTSLLVERFIPEAPPARLGYSGGGGRGPQGPKTLDAYNAVFARNLFNSAGKIPGESNGAPQELQLGCASGSQSSKTTLPFNLVGTLIVRNELRSIATIEDKTASAVYPVRRDDEIPGKARIVSVEARKVTFVNVSSGRCEFVDLPEDEITKNSRVSIGAKPTGKGVERISANQFNVSRAVVDKSLQDLNKVLTEARAVPNFENGLPAGYKLFQIVPGSIYDTLGLQNGDTICGLNGQGINDPGKAFELLGELKTASNLELCVKRDGKQQQFQYEIR